MEKSVRVPNRIADIQWREFLCGWGAACVNITITYPINKIIFRQVCITLLKKLDTSNIFIVDATSNQNL